VHYDESGFNAQLGILPTYIVSSSSPHKVEMNSAAPLSAEALAYEQHAVDAIANTFIARIAKGRGVSQAFARQNFGGGRMLTAAASVRAKLADRVDSLQNVLAKARAAGPARRAGRSVLAAAQRREDFEDDMVLSDSPAERQLGRELRADRVRGQAEHDALEMELAIRSLGPARQWR
jgi:ClpP class serine protease